MFNYNLFQEKMMEKCSVSVWKLKWKINSKLQLQLNAYDADKGEDYLEGGIQHSFGIKPEIKNKFVTPAPNAYNADKGED